MVATRSFPSVAFVASLVAALVWLVAHPWLHSRLDWEAVADAPNHLIRIYVVYEALAQGSLYPRWLPDLYLGYGYPLLNFYAPATYYVAAALHALGLTIYASLQWTGVLALVLASTGAYALASTLTGRSRAAGALAAVLYVAAPYPFITNLLVRAAVPEALALGLLPWLLVAAHLALHQPTRARVAAVAFSVAALMLTHNVSALIGLPLVAAYTAFTLVAVARNPLTALRAVTAGVLLGLALSAFFWLPALLESAYVQLDLLQGGIYSFRTWLFDPLLTGPSTVALLFDYSSLGKASPERISPWQLALWLCAVPLCLARLRHPLARLGLLFGALAFICWLLATIWSTPLWERLPLIGYIQFPWRFYGPLALCLALAVACSLPATGSPRTFSLAATALIAAALAVSALANRPLLLEPVERPHDVDSRNLAAKEYNRYGMGTTSGGEFLPRTVNWPVEGSTRRGIRIYEEAYPQAGWQAGFARVLEGRAAVTQIHRDLSGIAVDVDAETPAKLGIHQLAFPGWRATVDGLPVPIGIARYEPYDAALGFIVVDVPAGRHRVEARFGPTRVRHVANALSAAALILLALAFAPIGRRLPASAIVLTIASAGAALATVALGELQARPGATVRPTAAHVVSDLLGAVQSGQAHVRTPAGSGPALFPPYVERQYKWVRGEERRWLYMHPPSELTLPLRVPPDTYFQSGLALDPSTWYEPLGDGVRFVVEADTQSGRVTLLDRHIHPRARLEEQGWNDVWVPLTALAGQDITLRLRTEHAADPTFDWSGWSNPQIVRYQTSRPHPGTEHKW